MKRITGIGMRSYNEAQRELTGAPRAWLVTGAAGFIGSNLVESLLKLGQRVVGLDNFSSGSRENLQEVRANVGPAQWGRFQLIEGDIAELSVCQKACAGVDFVLHHAALGSVPASMADPLATHRSNVTGFLNVLFAARAARVRRLVYASSSSVYGDDPKLPKIEELTGRPLSPYAATKTVNEVYAATFAAAYGFESIGLRYFNVFGPRQDPAGAYAAVIPKWISVLLRCQRPQVNGDGQTTRDFCYVDNVVQANLLAATVPTPEAMNQVFNVALGERTTLLELLELIQKVLRRHRTDLPEQQPDFQDFRAGDVRHSQADIGKARRLLGYAPTHGLEAGLDLAMEWYCHHLR